MQILISHIDHYSNKVCILHVPSVILAIATNFANVGTGSGDKVTAGQHSIIKHFVSGVVNVELAITIPCSKRTGR